MQNVFPVMCLSDKEHLNDHRCERTDIAAEWKYLLLLLNTELVLYIDTYVSIISKVFGIKKEKEICQPNREYMWSEMWKNIYGCWMHST